MVKQTLIIDADDTLWETEMYYEQCIADFGELMESVGFDREEAEQIVDDVERERVPLAGYGPREFIYNLNLAYERLCERYGRRVDEKVAEAACQIGAVVLEPPMVLLDGVTRVLPRLGQHFQLILLTKGDHEVQKSKLERSGLATYFAGVHIVPEKDAEVLRGLMDEYSLHPARTWMVGNSPRSDINPALEVGIGAVHIPHTLTWTLEDEAITDLKRVVALDSFEELEDLFFETNDRIKAVIFDWGGVLQTLPDEAYRAEWERRLGLVPGALASMFRELQRPLILGEIGNDEYIQQVADRLGFSSVEVAERFTDHFYSVVRLNSDVLAAVKKLRETYRVALLTNAWPDADKLFLKKQGIDVRAEFDVYVNSAEVGLAKPDPAIYWLTLERLDVRPQEAVSLDDNPRNVEAARALGIQTIHVTDVPKALVELEALLQSCNLTVALSQ